MVRLVMVEGRLVAAAVMASGVGAAALGPEGAEGGSVGTREVEVWATAVAAAASDTASCPRACR